MKISRELKVGILFILGLALLFWGYNFLKGKNVFSTQRVFYAIYENVNGLNPSNTVSINGLDVGRVKDIYFEENYSGRIVAVLTVNKDFPIPKNSIARIFSADLMGSKEVAIVLGNSREMVVSGDTLMSDSEASLKEEVNRQVQPLKIKAEALLGSIDSVATIIKEIFNKGARENLTNSFSSIEKTFYALQHTTMMMDTMVREEANRLSNIIANVDSITSNLNADRDNISNIIANFSSLSDSLVKADVATTFTNANKAIGELAIILEKVNKGEGSVGALIHNDSLYLHIEKSMSDLNKLLEDIRKNPKKYVRLTIF